MALGPAKVRRARGEAERRPEQKRRERASNNCADNNCADKKMSLFSDISTASRPLLFKVLEAVRFTDNVVPAPHSLGQLGEWGANNHHRYIRPLAL